MNIDLLQKIIPKRKGDRLVNAGILFIAVSMIGGYGEFSVAPNMQVVGVVAGIAVILMGMWISHNRSKFKSSQNRKQVKPNE